jgi:hypothetical protein
MMNIEDAESKRLETSTCSTEVQSRDLFAEVTLGFGGTLA